MKISLIAAVGKNNEIGKDNKLLWNLKGDMKFFRETTTGHTVVMGKNTFLSIGKALPKRTNIVLSSTLKSDEVIVCKSVNEALSKIKDDEEVFIIGGEKVYREFLPYADNIYLTEVDDTFFADAFFPIFEKNDFTRKVLKKNEENGIKYEHVLYQRKDNGGKLIVIEGALDGIGKSTQFNLLKERLINDGNKVISHHFPSYDTDEGKLAQNYLTGMYGSPSELSPYFINSLYAVDRAITWKKDFENEYNKGNVILLDRYTTSSLIYQAALIEDLEEKKRFIDYVIDFEYQKLGIKKPDKVIFLTMPFDLISKLRNNRKENDGVKGDVYERDLDLLKKVYDNANFVANYLNFDIINCNDGDKIKSINDINGEIYDRVKRRI